MQEPRGAHRHRSVLWLVVWWAGFACASGNGSAIPRGSPRLAPGSTPEPLRYEVVVAGRRPVVRTRVARLLTDSLFYVTSADLGAVTAYSLNRLAKIRVEVVPAGKDSMRLALTGETYIGDTTRRDSISGLPERWRLITANDPTAQVLRGLARAIRMSRGERPVSGSEADGATPPPGEAQPPGDPAIVALLATTPVGRSADVCRDVQVPAGWLVLFWYRDRARCTGPAYQAFRDEPNMMRIEREW
jgi:hypothetical protein